MLRRYKPRSVLLESKEIEDETLLFESNTIATLSKSIRANKAVMFLPLFVLSAVGEVDIIRKEYGEAVAAYGCLGVLQLAQGTETFHYLVLITDCQSVGKVTRQPYPTGSRTVV